MAAVAALVSVVLLVACGGDDGDGEGQPAAAELEDVSIRLPWIPGGSHVGYFTAKDQGFYEEVGLNVEIIPGRGSSEVVQQVATGGDKFGQALGTGIVAGVAEGAPIKAVAGLTTLAGGCLLVRADSGIETPEDLEGKTIGAIAGSPLSAVLPRIWDEAGVDEDTVTIREIDSASTYPSLARGRIDAFTGIAHADPTLMEVEFDTEAGCIPYDDYGADSKGASIIASEETIENDPETVEAFVEATLRGLRYAFENPEEAGAALEAGAEGIEGAASAEVVAAQVPNLREDAVPSETVADEPYGTMAAEDWNETIEMMVEFLDLSDPPSATDVFTNEFVPEGKPLD